MTKTATQFCLTSFTLSHIYSSELLFKELNARKLNGLCFYHATLQNYKDDILNKSAPFQSNRNLRQTSNLPTPQLKKNKIDQLN